jgi:prepilin-type N-terminal cleavage/methylation domain-containing protein
MKTAHSPQHGFSLIELLIVVAVISIIAALAIPWLIAAKQAARSASAIAALRLVHQCESSYRAARGVYGDRAALSSAKYLSDPDIIAGLKQEYQISVTPDSTDPSIAYEAEAVPLSTPTALWYHYFVNATGVIRKKQGARATANDTPIN